MARTNTPTAPTSGKTHEGAPARRISAEQELERSVLSCLLWEGEFYEDGGSIGQRIERLAQEVAPQKVAALAVRARSEFHLRHVPLWLCVGLARRGALKVQTLTDVIQRADEMGEFLALYWRDGRVPLAAVVKRGLAGAFPKFDAYQLGKYDRADAVRLRDVMFLTHPTPKDEEQAAMWKSLVDGTLPAPDTWEVALSGGANKRGAWERLLAEKRLGAMALIRNLRNMVAADVPLATIREGLVGTKPDRVLPFRFISAAQAVPQLELELDTLMLRCCEQLPKLEGETVLVIDVSGSMYGSAISKYSEMDRAYAACALGALVREVCTSADIYATAGNDGARVHATARVPARRGMALVDAVYNMCRPLGGGGIFLKQCLDAIWVERREKAADRVIVITDEQDCDNQAGGSPLHARQIAPKQYMLNVASNERGVGYGPWTHLDGFSEAVLQYIAAMEHADG